MGQAGNTNRAGLRTPVRATRRSAAMVAMVLFLAACGGSTPDLGSAADAPITTVAPVTTTATTEPTMPTTSIDFGPALDQGLSPLDEEAGPDDVAALLDDIRGPSADIATQIGRLAPFLAIQGPSVARITDVSVTLSPEVDDAHPATARVRFWIPGDGEMMLEDLDDELRSIGWFQAGGTTGMSERGQPTTVAYFRNPGFRADELELEVSFEDGPGPSLVEFGYVLLGSEEQVDRGDGVTYFERLSAWQEDVPLPRAAELLEVGVETSADAAVLQATYLLSAEDEAEAVSLAAGALGGSSFQLLGASADDPPISGPLRLVDEDGTIVILDFTRSIEAEQFEIVATTGIGLTPVD